MNIKVPTKRFIVPSLRAGFYQQLTRRISGFQELGHGLIKEIETARAFRHDRKVIELASILNNLPTKEHQLIGQYYQGWLGQKTGENVRSIFERVAEESMTYKAKALMSIAATEARRGNYDEELRYIKEASKSANDPSLVVEVSRGIAIVRAKEGDHKQAVKEFEKIFPLVRHVRPIFYYQYLNSFAVELAQVGALREASNICDVILASPYAFAYPEWRETSEEIRLREYHSRSVISFSQVSLHNILPPPERSRVKKSTKQPGKLLSFTDWKSKMVKEPDGEQQLPDDMTAQDMAMKLVELITENKDQDDKLREVLDYAIEVFSRQ